jgi:hypothetical protein
LLLQGYFSTFLQGLADGRATGKLVSLRLLEDMRQKDRRCEWCPLATDPSILLLAAAANQSQLDAALIPECTAPKK